MKMRMTLTIFIAVFFCNIPAFSFSVPQLFWPQKDLDSFSVNQPFLAKKVLVVSRDSEFKRTIVDKIKDAFKGEPVFIKGVGLTKLKNEDASAYGAIVIINTCMSWDWDNNIHAFLKGKQNAGNVIVLTTSGNAKWLPKKAPTGLDAIASASKQADVVAVDLVGRIRSLLATR
jgi:nucleoside-triphosphatase THEP1